MASQSGGMTGPFWSADKQQHYWYDQIHDRIIFDDGLHIQRPESIPRARLLTPTLSYKYSGSPPGTGSGYMAMGTATRAPASNAAPGGRAVPDPAGVRNITSTLSGLSVGGSTSVATRTPQDPYVQTIPSKQVQTTSYSQQPSAQQTRQAREYTAPDGVKTTLTDLTEGKIVDVFNPNNRVRTLFQTGPAQDITDPSLLQEGRGKSAYRKLITTGSEGDTEQLFSTFEVRTSPRRFFIVGKVFMVLWSEPAGEARTHVTGGVSAGMPGTTKGRYGENVFSKVRRFVVIREASNYCSALPITTYGSQGVSKPNVTKSEHAIIYTGRQAPAPMAIEEPLRGEQGMRPDPIRVDPDDREDKLDPRSRIDFGKVHTIQHNIKVKSYGKVNERSMQALIKQFNNCWYASSVPTVTPAAIPSPLPASSRGQAETRAPAAVRRPSVSSGQRSQLPRGSGSGGSQTGTKAAQRSQPLAVRDGGDDDDDEGESRNRPGEREIIARVQERQRQQYWAAVEQSMQRNSWTREQAMQVINAQLAQRRNAAARAQEVDVDDDDDDDDDVEN